MRRNDLAYVVLVLVVVLIVLWFIASGTVAVGKP